MSAYNESNGINTWEWSKLLLPDNSFISLAPAGGWIGRHDFSGKISDSIIQQISREHLFIGMENGTFYIEDRGSTNGTSLNGQQIGGTGRHFLHDGDTLELGGVATVYFKQPAPAAQISVQAATASPVSTPSADAAYMDNTSGLGKDAVIPPGIKKWHWGAFFLNWIWGIGNNVWIALLCLIPMVNIVMIFILGANGNEWAWRSKRWDSIAHFKKMQRKWTVWGVGLFIAAIVINILYLVILRAAFRRYM